MAKVQIYLLPRADLPYSMAQYILCTHTQSRIISRATLVLYFLPLSWPKQHRHMIQWESRLEQHSEGAQQRGWSGRAEPCHGSGQCIRNWPAAKGKPERVHSCTSRSGCWRPDSARLRVTLRSNSRGTSQNMNFLHLNSGVSPVLNTFRFAI